MKCTLGLLLLAAAFAAEGPPNPFIDRGACPFECCLYRKWRATKPMVLVDHPNGNRTMARLRSGEWVTAITGETRSEPLAMAAPHDFPQAGIRAGDRIFVLHFKGEGVWAVWFRGRLVDVELYGLKIAPKSEWWAKVRTARGVVGWVRAENNFENQDGCG